MDQRTKKILAILEKEYGDLKPGLTYESPFQLLIAVILSAQCTDVRVNKVTSRLFAKYKTPEDFVKLEQAELEEEIRECGLFRNKAKNIRETCAILVEKYGGQVPSAREELMSLPGVGRKSANVILSQAFGQDAPGRRYPCFPGQPPAGPGPGQDSPGHRAGIAAGYSPFPMVPGPSLAHLARPPGVPGPEAPLR